MRAAWRIAYANSVQTRRRHGRAEGFQSLITGHRIVARLSEYPERAESGDPAAVPRNRETDLPVRVSGGVGDPVAVELEQIVRRGD